MTTNESLNADMTLVSEEVANLERIISDLLKENEPLTTSSIETIEQLDLEEKIHKLKVLQVHLAVHKQDIEDMKDLSEKISKQRLEIKKWSKKRRDADEKYCQSSKDLFAFHHDLLSVDKEIVEERKELDELYEKVMKIKTALVENGNILDTLKHYRFMIKEMYKMMEEMKKKNEEVILEVDN